MKKSHHIHSTISDREGRRMTLQQLTYLTALAESNSIRQAAQGLFVTQSGISKSIQQLEKELGFPLLDRSSKGVIFTAQGTRFLKDAYALLGQYDAMRKLYIQDGVRPAAGLSITSRYYVFVARAVARMTALLEGQNYTLSLREGRVGDILHDVSTRKSQLGILSYYDTNEELIQRELDRAHLEFHSLCSSRLHVFLSKEHPLAGASTVTLSMLAPYPYVFYDAGQDPYGYTEEIFFPVHPQKAVSVTDRDSMLTILRHSQGYALGSGWLSEDRSELVTRPLSFPADITMQVGWVAPQGQTLSEKCRQFLDLCRDAWREGGVELSL